VSMRIPVAGDRFVPSELRPWPMRPLGPVAEVGEASGSEEEWITAIKGVEVVVTRVAPLARRVIGSAEALRLIVCTRGGPVNVKAGATYERGIAVRNTPGRNGPAAAEFIDRTGVAYPA
jgi:D-3-phosphoglycerate dehydrogenase